MRHSGYWLLAGLFLSACGRNNVATETPEAAPEATAPTSSSSSGLQASFEAAAAEFGVPVDVLLSVSYNETRWESHAGMRSRSGGYGVMHLVESVVSARDMKGTGEDLPAVSEADARRLTLKRASDLLGISPELLKVDTLQNIRGGAALLAQLERELPPDGRSADERWYNAVARYSGSEEVMVAKDFADQVYETLRSGAALVISSGESVTLEPRSVASIGWLPDGFPPQRIPPVSVECPLGLSCSIVPAAYTPINGNLSDYGSYDIANRPFDGQDIKYILIHDTELSYQASLNAFQNPSTYVAPHYLIRSSDGLVANMTPSSHVAWHAGNWWTNMHCVGIELEGVASEPTWFNETMYRATARLTRYLAKRHNIPLSRGFIIGHDDVPGVTGARQAGMHWDPGPFFDWNHFMDLVGAPPPSASPNSPIITIKPNFATNQPAMNGCVSTTCAALPLRPANFVYLRTAADSAATYVVNQYMSTVDPLLISNWSTKAVSGQQFVSAGRQGDWQSIYYGGVVAWFYDPPSARTAVPSSGMVITAKPGLSTIPVYGRAYPEAAAYPSNVPVQALATIYTMPAGQSYVAFGPHSSTYYHAVTYTTTLAGSGHTLVKGQTLYYTISYNHRQGFVKADDVVVTQY